MFVLNDVIATTLDNSRLIVSDLNIDILSPMQRGHVSFSFSFVISVD